MMVDHWDHWMGYSHGWSVYTGHQLGKYGHQFPPSRNLHHLARSRLPTRLGRPQLEDPLRQRLAMCRLGRHDLFPSKKTGETRWIEVVGGFFPNKKISVHSGVAKLQEFIFIIIFNVEL